MKWDKLATEAVRRQGRPMCATPAAVCGDAPGLPDTSVASLHLRGSTAGERTAKWGLAVTGMGGVPGFCFVLCSQSGRLSPETVCGVLASLAILWVCSLPPSVLADTLGAVEVGDAGAHLEGPVRWA